MISEKKLVEWLKGKKYITVNENSTEMAEEFEKEHQWELSRNCFINKVINFIEEQPKVNEWIPCSERLPEDNEMSEYYDSVIVTLDNGRVANGCYRNYDKEWWVDAEDGKHNSINATGHIIAWQPLPEPYREKVEE